MKSTLTQANSLLRQKNYTEALELYGQAIQECPEMVHIIRFNMELAEKRRLLWPETVIKAFDAVSANDTPLHDKEGIAKTIEGGQDRYTIKDSHQLTRDPVDPKLWESHGEDPYFVLDPGEIFSQSGTWYAFSLQIRSARKTNHAKLYFDHGSGFNEVECIGVLIKSGEAETRIFHCDQPPKALRFDPKEGPGEFRIEAISLNSIQVAEAMDVMLRRLADCDDQFLSWSYAAIMEHVFLQAQNDGINLSQKLFKFYKKTFSKHPQAIAYQEWIETVEPLSLPSPETVQATLETISKPLISIVMPVYNTPEVYLRACIDTVLAQSYPHWELCIADDKSPKPHVRKVLEDCQAKDARIRVVYRKQNGHISRASNSALEIAQGDYVALLDHDDALPEHALYFMALAINDRPDAQVLYSDEDKIDTKGKRHAPHFKSDWNPDLFYSQNYVSHLGVYKRELLNRIGGFRAGVEGSQDQDLLLRCLPHVNPGQIIHVPRVLYHWRIVEGSTALASGEKSYTTEAGIKALRDYFTEHGPESVRVEAGLLPNTYRVQWPVPDPAPLVSLLIPTRDKKAITEVAVRSILDKTTYPNYEIIILDNGSIEPETIAWFAAIQQEDARVKIIRYDHPFNYSAINNFGAVHARGSILGLVNNDIEVIAPDWLTEMVGHACREDIGCVGAKLYYGNGTLQHGGVILGIGGVANHSHKHSIRNSPGYFARLIVNQNFSAVTAACLIVRREIYEAVGGLDEEDLKIAFNDVDFCLKVREAGYRNLWTPYAELYHHESISRGVEDTPKKQARFRKEVEFMQTKWGDALKHDPYYNPNLTRDREDFTISDSFYA